MFMQIKIFKGVNEHNSFFLNQPYCILNRKLNWMTHRNLILVTALFILISCRKDNTYAPFLGNYYFTKLEWSYCSGCPPERTKILPIIILEQLQKEIQTLLELTVMVFVNLIQSPSF